MPGSAPPPDLVVSNTTPLIMLVGVGSLDLLPLLYGEIVIPDAVRAEYLAGIKPGEPAPDTLPWLKIESVSTDLALLTQLDAGEAAAISLAIARNASLILLDEQKARNVARGLGLRIAGSLAVLLLAKQRGHIAAVAPIVDHMIAQGRHISTHLRAQILTQAGE